MQSASSLMAAIAAAGLVAGAFAQQTNDVDPNGALMNAALTGGTTRGHGDLVAGPFDVETGPFDNRCLGVEEAWGHYWVTGRGHTTLGDIYMIHKYDMAGVYLASYPQNVSAANVGGWGGRDMEADEAANTLWVGNDSGYVEVMTYDPITGGIVYGSTVMTSVTGTVRALCQNPNTGNFFTKSFTSSIYEFDMSTGAVVNTFTNTAVSAYGFGWDYAQDTIWSTDALASATELDPANGMVTGRGFSTVLGGSQGGADVYDDPLNANGPSMVMLHQTTPDSIAVYDTSGSPPPPPPAWPNLPTGFMAADGYFDDFESYGGVVPGHFAVNELDGTSGLPDPEAYCDIAGSSGLGAFSGTACLEMGLDPLSNNYHDVRNGLVIGLNGAGAASLDMDFQAIDHGEETDTWDGVWTSDDGLVWYQAYGPWTSLLSSWQAVTGVNLDGAGANTDGDFYLLFAQDDNFPYGYLDGLGADDISIVAPPPPGPSLAVYDLTGGMMGTLEVTNATPGGIVVMGASMAGGGPTSTVYGDVMLSPPIHVRWNTADAAGTATWSHQVYPHLTGKTLYFHAVDDTTGDLSNPLMEVVG